MLNAKKILSAIMLFILGILTSIIIYRLLLFKNQNELESAYPGSTLSSSFFIDWPLNIIFVSLPILIILFVLWLIIFFKKQNAQNK